VPKPNYHAEKGRNDQAKWEWLRKYRIWDANRKVFIYPENWLEPDSVPPPAAVLVSLREIASAVRAQSGDANVACLRDVRVLFTGKNRMETLVAAQTLATDLGMNLYRIDLGQIVSKYIGETEKNLRRVFDAANAEGTIRFFDEADALFNRRSDVHDSHDRYANIEINYLLQRIEEFDGVVILSVKRKEKLDKAFLRRFQFIISIPSRKPPRQYAETKEN
jgi:hypothetical protein